MFILGAGFAMALAAASLLLSTGRSADRWLAAMGLAAALATGAIALARAEVSLPGVWPAYLAGPVFMATPAFFYLYIRAMTGAVRFLDWAWLLPGLIYGLGLVLVAFAMPDALGVEAGLTTLSGEAGVWLTPMPILVTLILPVAGLVQISRHRKRLEANLAELDSRDLAWARALLWLNLFVIAFSAVSAGLAAQFGLDASVRVFDLFVIFLAVQLGAILHFAARERRPVLEREPALAAAPAPARLDAKALNALLDDDALLLRPDLRIRDVSDAAGLPVEDLSHAIRTSLDESFFDFVNRRRVERVQALLTTPGNEARSLLDLAFEAGFQSKATFNRVFRAQTGHTPSQWRKGLNP